MKEFRFMYDGVEVVVDDQRVLNQLEIVEVGFGMGKEIVKLNETPDGRRLKTAIQVCKYEKDVEIPHAKNRYTKEGWLNACMKRVGDDGVDGMGYAKKYGGKFNPAFIGMRYIEFSKGYAGVRLNGCESTEEEKMASRRHHMLNRSEHLSQISNINDEMRRRKEVENRNEERWIKNNEEIKDMKNSDDIEVLRKDYAKRLFLKVCELECAVNDDLDWNVLDVLKKNVDDFYEIAKRMCK